MMNNYEIDETAWKRNFSDTLQRAHGEAEHLHQQTGG